MYAQLSVVQSYRQWRLWPLVFFVAPRDVVPCECQRWQGFKPWLPHSAKSREEQKSKVLVQYSAEL